MRVFQKLICVYLKDFAVFETSAVRRLGRSGLLSNIDYKVCLALKLFVSELNCLLLFGVTL